MPRSLRDEEFSEFVRARRVELLRSACLLTAGDTAWSGQASPVARIALCRVWSATAAARSAPLARIVST